jgi:hypothetical protein
MFPRTYGTFHLVPLVDWLGPSQPLNRGASAPKHPWIVEHPKRLLCGRGCRAPVASGTVDTYAMLALFTGVQLIPSSYPPTVGVRGSTPAVDCSPKPHRGAGIASISQLLHDKIRFRDATRHFGLVARFRIGTLSPVAFANVCATLLFASKSTVRTSGPGPPEPLKEDETPSFRESTFRCFAIRFQPWLYVYSAVLSCRSTLHVPREGRVFTPSLTRPARPLQTHRSTHARTVTRSCMYAFLRKCYYCCRISLAATCMQQASMSDLQTACIPLLPVRDVTVLGT